MDGKSGQAGLKTSSLSGQLFPAESSYHTALWEISIILDTTLWKPVVLCHGKDSVSG